MKLEPLREVFPDPEWFTAHYPDYRPVVHEEVPDISRTVARHPDGRHVAIQVYLVELGPRAAVWDVETGRIVWQRSGTTALCWTDDGSELIVVRRGLRPDLDFQRDYGGVGCYQSDYQWFFERWAWPDAVCKVSCGIKPATGYLEGVAISPKGNLAAILWNEQHADGIELIGIGDEGDSQLIGKGYEANNCFSVKPVFNNNGEYLVFAVEDEMDARDAQFFAGQFVFLDIATLKYYEIQIVDELTPGWRSRVTETVEELDLYRRAKQRAMIPIEGSEGATLLAEMYQREWE